MKENNKNKRILVTGATGFTGGVLTKTLLRNGKLVRILVREKSSHKTFGMPGSEISIGDLASGDGLEKAVEGIDTVYHIAAAFRVEGVPVDYFHRVNVEGTRELLEASLKAGVRRFVHCSTVGVHGEIERPPADESAPFRPGDHYQQSKLEGEKLALEYYKKGLGVVVFRPFGMYGPGDTRFLKLFKPVVKGKWIIVGKGDNLYQLTYITDLIKGIILCGTVQGIEGEVFIIGGDRTTTIKELGKTIAKTIGVENLKILSLPVMPVWIAAYLCEIICRLIKIEPPIYRRRLDFFLKDRAFNIEKAKNRLNYQPEITLEKGIKKTIEWYKKEGLI